MLQLILVILAILLGLLLFIFSANQTHYFWNDRLKKK